MADKAWVVRVGDRWVQVQDLPVGVLADIATENRVSWVEVLATPARDAGVAQAVLAAAHAHLSVELPTGLSGRDLLSAFELVDDDKPTDWDEGVPTKGADR